MQTIPGLSFSKKALHTHMAFLFKEINTWAPAKVLMSVFKRTRVFLGETWGGGTNKIQAFGRWP